MGRNMHDTEIKQIVFSRIVLSIAFEMPLVFFYCFFFRKAGNTYYLYLFCIVHIRYMSVTRLCIQTLNDFLSLFFFILTIVVFVISS